MKKSKIRVLIADDHRILLEGLVLMLKDEPSIEIVSTAANGEEVLTKMSSYYVDVLLMDIQMPVLDGYETAKIITTKFKETKIIILSMHSQHIYIQKMFLLGVSGYLLKSSSKEEILEAINKVYSGSKYFSSEVTTTILEQNLLINKKKISFDLTKREKEILKLIASGFSNSDISKNLFLSIATVKTHRKNLMRKLDINNSITLVKYALENFKQEL
jgi:DNA-binding NarL/FixJ family response regulator